MAGPRTRAKGASPGGLKSLDDIPKARRGKGKKIKTEPVEDSIESESADPYTTSAEGNNNTESQKARSSPTNDSRTNSPESHSPSPTPAESRLDSRSTSPPLKNTTTSNDASSDNDVINKDQDAERIAPLGSSKKRSRAEESSSHQSDGNTEGNAEEILDERSSKRPRFEDVEADVEAEESTDPEPEKKTRGRPRNRTKATPKKSANKTRGHKQDPIVLNGNSSDEAAETTVSPPLPRSTPKQTPVPSPITPQNQQERSSAEKDELKAGLFAISRPTSKLTLPPPDLRPVPQTEVQKPAPSLADIGPDPEQRMKAAAKHFGFPPIARAVSSSTIKLTPGMGKTARIRAMHMQKYFPGRYTSPSKGKEVVKEVVKEAAREVTKDVTQGANDVAQTERKKTTAVASSSETLSKSDVSSATRQSPRDGLKLTDPYLVAVAKAFTNHKEKSKAMPSIEQVAAFLDGFDAQQGSYNSKTQMVAKKSTLPQPPKTSRSQGFVVPGYGSDDDTVMSDEGEGEAQVVEEPKTPEPQDSLEQDDSPSRSSWWNPISTVATMLTSPFRKQSTAAPAPLARNKVVPPPFIFKQPPTTPAAVPLKRNAKSDRKRNTRNNLQGRHGAGFQTERRPRRKDVTQTPVHMSGLLTPDEIKEIHRAQDEYAAKHNGKGPLIVANRDIHKAARDAKRSAVVDAAEEESLGFTHVKAGDKRNSDGAPKFPCQRWNDFLNSESSDEEEEPRWIRCRNGLYIRSDATERQLEGELIKSDDPRYLDFYRDIDAFPKQNIYKPAGVQNPLNSAQLLEQANLRAMGDPNIPDESLNDYTYVINEHQKRLIFYPRSPYNMFDIPGRKLNANHIANLKEGYPLLNPRDEFGIAIKVPRYDSTRPPHDQNTTNVFEQLHEWDKRRHYKDAADMKAGRILEPKQWTQTPPPKPKPGNAKLPGTLDRAPMSEAVQQAMNKANKYLPAKSSGLRNVATMSPVQGEQSTGMELTQEVIHPLQEFDSSEEALGWKCDPEIMAAVAKCDSQGLISITPVPDHIWHEHEDLVQGEVEQAVAALFKGVDARFYGTAHNGISANHN